MLNNGVGLLYMFVGYVVFDLFVYYDIIENLCFIMVIYNFIDKEYYCWEVFNSVRDGIGGFFGGVSGNGY